MSRPITYSSDWTRKLESRRHWEFYWQQQNLLFSYLQGGRKSLLEVGVGSGFAANYLRSRGHSVTTLDIDAAKKPDIVEDLRNFTSAEGYDALLAFEVFEHMPWDDFEAAALRFRQFVRERLFVSLPRKAVTLARGNLYLPIVGERSFWFGLPRRRIKIPTHHWEVGPTGVTLQRLDAAIAAGGFRLEKRFKFQNQIYSEYARAD